MEKQWTDRERMLAVMFRETTVALGCELIKRVGENEASQVFGMMMQRRVDKMKEDGLLGSGFQVLVDMVSKTAPFFGQDITFDVENMICKIRGCGLWEAGKKLGYAKTPLCIRCKANSDTVLAHVLPGYRKTIVKSLWWGDDECYMIYKKEK
jgi:hypothetical protein